MKVIIYFLNLPSCLEVEGHRHRGILITSSTFGVFNGNMSNHLLPLCCGNSEGAGVPLEILLLFMTYVVVFTATWQWTTVGIQMVIKALGATPLTRASDGSSVTWEDVQKHNRVSPTALQLTPKFQVSRSLLNQVRSLQPDIYILGHQHEMRRKLLRTQKASLLRGTWALPVGLPRGKKPQCAIWGSQSCNDRQNMGGWFLRTWKLLGCRRMDKILSLGALRGWWRHWLTRDILEKQVRPPLGGVEMINLVLNILNWGTSRIAKWSSSVNTWKRGSVARNVKGLNIRMWLSSWGEAKITTLFSASLCPWSVALST